MLRAKHTRHMEQRVNTGDKDEGKILGKMPELIPQEWAKVFQMRYWTNSMNNTNVENACFVEQLLNFGHICEPGKGLVGEFE